MIFTNTESNKSFVSLSLLKTQSSCQWFIVCRLSTFEWKSKWYECTHLINNRLTTSCSSDIFLLFGAVNFTVSAVTTLIEPLHSVFPQS